MRRNWSTIFSYASAVLVFFIAASWAILYATGYKIDWQDWSLKKIGFILIETYPKGASIKLAGKSIDKVTPTTIKRLLPKTYQIELTKDTYRPWTGDVVVESGLVAEQRNILLTLQDLPTTVLWEHPIDRLMANGDNSRLALVVKNELWLWDVKNKKDALILSPTLLSQQIKDRNITDITKGSLVPISFAPDNKTLLVQSRGARNYYWLSVDSDNGRITWLASGKNITNWKWINNTELGFLQNNQLNLIITSSKQIKTLATNIIDYGLIDGNLYAVNKNKAGKFTLVKVDRGGFIPSEEISELRPASNYYLGKIKNNWLVIATTGNLSTILLSDKSSDGLVWQTLADKVTGKVLWDDTYLIFAQDGKLTTLEWKDVTKPKIIADHFKGDLVHFSFDTILYWDIQKLHSIDLTGQNNYDLLSLSSADEFAIVEPQMSKWLLLDTKTRYLSEVTLREKQNSLINF
ncbi:MAG: PEGA domain-containing protein [Patescibacteria group bacterium]|jgi:hypothetical protein